MKSPGSVHTHLNPPGSLGLGCLSCKTEDELNLGSLCHLLISYIQKGLILQTLWTYIVNPLFSHLPLIKGLDYSSLN